MFKEGDEIMCIIPSNTIKYGEYYIVDRICINPKTKLKNYLKLKGLSGAFRNDRFLTHIQTERLKKIKRLLNEH